MITFDQRPTLQLWRALDTLLRVDCKSRARHIRVYKISGEGEHTRDGKGVQPSFIHVTYVHLPCHASAHKCTILMYEDDLHRTSIFNLVVE